MNAIRLNDAPLIKALIIVLNNDQSNEVRKKCYNEEKQYISHLAEKILLEQEIRTNTIENNEKKYILEESYKTTEKYLKERLQSVEIMLNLDKVSRPIE